MQNGSNSVLKEKLAAKGFLELEDIIEAVKNGDNLAIEGLNEIGYNLGKGLAFAINMFNPDTIVLSGILSAIGNPFLLPVQSAVFQYSLSLVSSDTQIMVSDIPGRAGLLGACLLVRDKMLSLV
jgi:predicted NBD/HSP70 family sugar kinase